ncbi:T3SS effector HopA1 family protein [Staphylococcus canis]|uniref:Uncharacterized protein n=1 Tax=Staphylococcus canis TaxID=2724942 RepID=A0ABS0T8V7_9STAP|nr:T3SS effector HopA1 family protein [Staphylococcus canis]MBI5974391.1 hypothetical protein [Staphylococcus canis]
MYKSVNSFESIVKNIQLKADLDVIEINDSYYKGVLERPKGELIQWLYSNLHIGNEKKNDFKKVNNLDGDIYKRINDPGLKVDATLKNINGNDYVEVHGILLKENINKDGTVTLPCFRPNLTPGFFMFVHTKNGMHKGAVTRHYVYSDSSDYAVELWVDCLQELIDKNIDFSAKILSSEESYPRNDALVFYSSGDSDVVEEILKKKVQNNFKTPDNPSLLAETVTKNLSKADEPIKINGIQQSFGEHRCNAIADAIQDHFVTSVDFELLLKQRLKAYKIDLNNLSKNTVE